MKQSLKTIVVGFLGGLVGAYIYSTQFAPQLTSPATSSEAAYSMASHVVEDHQPAIATTQTLEPLAQPAPSRPVAISAERVNLVEASAKSTPSVVYITNVSQRSYTTSLFDWFFDGPSSQKQVSTGSGVIYTQDGYIITNNHVVEGGDKIEVTIDKKPYPAEVVGTDPSTDLAVLKIEATGLPAIAVGSSANLQVGEWVLAVGNPFNLTSTVTAGIVSAKGRSLNILRNRDFPIESFIQTDAAINPGNSGGALVNSAGELVGINTAILSRTGSYAGYGFAVPMDIVKKVAEDLIAYGEVQKAFVGAEVLEIDDNIAKRLDLAQYDGVVLNYTQRGGAADKAGLEKGDVLIGLQGNTIASKADYDEFLSYYSPGDKVTITYLRGSEENTTELLLTNRVGTTDILTREVYKSDDLEATFESIPTAELSLLKIETGVRLKNVKGLFLRRLGLRDDIVIVSVNESPANSPEEVASWLNNARGVLRLEIIDTQGIRRNLRYNIQ